MLEEEKKKQLVEDIKMVQKAWFIYAQIGHNLWTCQHIYVAGKVQCCGKVNFDYLAKYTSAEVFI